MQAACRVESHIIAQTLDKATKMFKKLGHVAVLLKEHTRTMDLCSFRC